MRKSLVFAAALFLLPAISQAKTLEDLLVEKGVITRAEAKTSAGVSDSKVFWNEGTRFEFPDTGFTAGFSTILQERYTFTDADEDMGGKNTSSFEQKKARIIISGSALDNEFSYYFQADFVGEKEATGENKPALKDAYITWNACDWGAMKMGQYKTFISKQYNVSDAKLQFPDRSVASDYFDLDRQQGLSAHWWTEDKMLQANAGIFNGSSDGEGVNRPGNDNLMTGVFSVRVNPIGKYDVSDETDVNYTEDFAATFGAAYSYGQSNNDFGVGLEHVNTHDLSVDTGVKYVGLSVSAEFFWKDEDPEFAESATPLGFYVQAGYFITPKKFELAARYSMIDCDDGKAGGICSGNDQVNEATAALNYYVWKHYLKASLAYSAIVEEMMREENSTTNRWMFQLSSYF